MNYNYISNLAICRAPTNGLLLCDGITKSYARLGESCAFTCNQGYSSQGPQVGTCSCILSYFYWSGGLPTCARPNCSEIISLSNDTYTYLQQHGCNRLTYLSQCTIFCSEGHTGDNVTYLSNVTSNSGVVDWVPISGVHSACERGI